MRGLLKHGARRALSEADLLSEGSTFTGIQEPVDVTDDRGLLLVVFRQRILEFGHLDRLDRLERLHRARVYTALVKLWFQHGRHGRWLRTE